MVAEKPSQSILSPFTQPRLWVILLWTLAMSFGIAGFDWMERYFDGQSGRQSLLLISSQTMDESQRVELAKKMEAESWVASAEWIAPADQARRLQSQFPDESWREAMPPDENWLPWVLEIKPVDPMRDPTRISNFVADRKQEGGWQVFWDGESISNLIAHRAMAQMVLGVLIAFALIAGGAALACLPRSAQWVAEWVFSSIFAILPPLAVWAALEIDNVPLDGRTLALAAVVGFVLASVVAPMLRQRRMPGRPRTSTFSTTVTEAPDERVR